MRVPNGPKVWRPEISLGKILIWLSLVLFGLEFFVSLAAEAYYLANASGAVLTLGYVLWLQREWRIYRKMPWPTLFLFFFMAFVIAVMTPIIMSTKHALSEYGKVRDR